MAVKDSDTTTVTFRLSRALSKRLKVAAAITEQSQQEIAERALLAYLEKLEKPGKAR